MSTFSLTLDKKSSVAPLSKDEGVIDSPKFVTKGKTFLDPRKTRARMHAVEMFYMSRPVFSELALYNNDFWKSHFISLYSQSLEILEPRDHC